MGFANDVIGGAAALIRAAIKSPNFVTGSTGWSVNKNGSAEFSNVTIRGASIIGGTTLEYNGVPALGNLIASSAPAAGSDAHGNAYLGGEVTYANVAGTFLALQQNANGISLWVSTAGAGGPYTISDQQVNFAWTSGVIGTVAVQASTVNLGMAGAGNVVQVLAPQFTVPGVLTATGGSASSPTQIATDSWNPFALINGWAAGPNGTPSYKLCAEKKQLWIAGELRQSTAPTSITIATIASPYLPLHTAAAAVGVASGGVTSGDSPFVQVDTSGNVTIGGVTIASNPIVVMSAVIPLDL